MTNKVLFTATVDIHFQAFHLPYLKWFTEQGWEVHVAASGEINLPYVHKRYTIPIERSPLNKINLKAYRELKKIIAQENFKIIHCHTPMGGVLTRLAAKDTRKNGTKIIYTAHGFHFCKGAPFLNWVVYYPIEKILSRITDCLITINQEDFKVAFTHKFRAKSIKHVHGVGVNTEVFKPIGDREKLLLRKRYGYEKDHFLMFYAAEFNKNKNQKLLIESLAHIKDTVPKARLLLAGDGNLLQGCKKLAKKLGIEDMVEFLGYRKDIESLLKISDAAVASSYREGLPVNIMEAMACGLPVIANNNRGHRELVAQDFNGWIIKKENAQEIASKIRLLAEDVTLRREFGLNGRSIILSKYSLQRVLEEKKSIYNSYINELEEVMWAVH